MQVETRAFIGGVWSSAQSGETFEVLDPSTEDLIAAVADVSASEALSAVDAAAAAFKHWRRTPPRQRAELLRKCFELMVEQREDLAQLISLENGKSLSDARREVDYAAEFFRWNAEEAVRIIGEFGRAPSGGYHIVVDHEPIGVAVLVTPWNFPAAMATRKMAPALAAGCTCVLKPASETPLTALAIAKIMELAGIPEGVVNVVPTSNAAPVVDAMLQHKSVRIVSFTGSTRTGKVLLHAAADRVLKSAMELGGNAPFIVMDDADMDAALDGAILAKMRNGGQACTAANRFFVHSHVYHEFNDRMAKRMREIVVGPGLDATTECGPLISAKAVERVDALVQDAVERGARILTGGSRPNRQGFFYPPTVIVDVAESALIRQEEIFGPVVAINSFSTADEAIELANKTEAGLVSYVFSRDQGKAMSLASRLEAGMIAVNRGLVSDPAAPFGGVKESGLGREGGKLGLLEFTEPKYMAVEWN